MNIDHSMIQTMAPRKLFLKFLLPSLFGMLLMAINILIDGLFISHGVGEQGLAGVNVAVPIYSIILSISLWVGMGGATLYSIHIGENSFHQAKTVFNQSIWLTILITAAVIIGCLIFETEVAYLFGANDSIIHYATTYLHIILLFGIIFVLENILSIFIRNDGNPVLAMMGLVVTSIVNIILNYIFIFVFQWGVKGAAYATIIGTIIGTLVLLTHFLKPQGYLRFLRIRLNPAIMRKILIIGLPSFIVEGSVAITMILFNITFSHFVGSTGLISYAIINTMHVVFLMLFIGIGAALQPITSYLYGAQLFTRMEIFIRLSVLAAFVLGIFLLIFGIIGNGLILWAFNVNTPEVYSYAKQGIRYFFIGYIFLGINMVFLEFYQSIEQTSNAICIVIARSIVFFIPLLFLLPYFFGKNTIWLAFPLAEGITLVSIYISIQLKWTELIPRNH